MSTLVLACGALAREILALLPAERFPAIHLHCLPATLHNRPERIAPAVRAALAEAAGRYDRVFVAYADCGTGGALDAVLAETGAERLPGAHCYAFFTGVAAFDRTGEADLRSFFLTDFLARHFETLVWEGLGLDRHPALRDAYFGQLRARGLSRPDRGRGADRRGARRRGPAGPRFRAPLRRLRRPRPGDGAAGGGVRALSASFLPI